MHACILPSISVSQSLCPTDTCACIIARVYYGKRVNKHAHLKTNTCISAGHVLHMSWSCCIFQWTNIRREKRGLHLSSWLFECINNEVHLEEEDLKINSCVLCVFRTSLALSAENCRVSLLESEWLCVSNNDPSGWSWWFTLNIGMWALQSGRSAPSPALLHLLVYSRKAFQPWSLYMCLKDFIMISVTLSFHSLPQATMQKCEFMSVRFLYIAKLKKQVPF